MKKENVDLLLNVAGDLDTDKADVPDVFLVSLATRSPKLLCFLASTGWVQRGEESQVIGEDQVRDYLQI